MAIVKHSGLPDRVATVEHPSEIKTQAELDYERMYRNMFPRLRDFARRYLDPEDALEIVQDVLTDVWKNWGAITADGEPPESFYFCAVRNRIANRRRDSFRQSSRLKEFLYKVGRRKQRVSAPEAILERAELARVIEQAVARMPERCREAWALIHQNGMTYAQAGEVMAVAAITVRRHATMGNALIAEALSTAGYALAAPQKKQRLLPETTGEENHD